MAAPTEGTGAVPALLEHEIAPALQEELLKHPGKWVAMTDDEIIAVGDSAGEVREKAHQAGIMVPSLYKVPEKPGLFFF